MKKDLNSTGQVGTKKNKGATALLDALDTMCAILATDVETITNNQEGDDFENLKLLGVGNEKLVQDCLSLVDRTAKFRELAKDPKTIPVKEQEVVEDLVEENKEEIQPKVRNLQDFALSKKQG